MCYFSIREALASHYARLGTREGFKTAVRLEPDNAENWHRLGRSCLYDAHAVDVACGVRALETAVKLDPNSADAWLDLAAAYGLEDKPAAQREALLSARRAYPSSAEVAWKYGDFLLAQGQLADGVREIRSAVEGDPKRGLEAFSLLRRYEPDVETILDHDLPPEPGVFRDVAWELTNEKKPDDFLKAWAKLASLRPQISDIDARYFVGGLLQQQRIAEAETVWDQATGLMALPKLDDPPGSLLWDGGFETNVTDGGFAWRIEKSPHVFVTRDSKSAHSGARSLRVDFDDPAASQAAGVCHFAAVEPGASYEFSAWLSTADFAQSEGVFFRLRAVGSQETPSLTKPVLGNSSGWTRRSDIWTAPAGSHLLDVCLLHDPSSEPMHDHSTVWVDGVSLIKVSRDMAGSGR